jgi:hypothetical protein
MREIFFINDNVLFVQNNNGNYNTFEINLIEKVKINEIFNKTYNIFLSIFIILGSCFLIIQSYKLFLFFFIIPYLALYFLFNQKKRVLKFKYRYENFEFIIHENDFMKLEELVGYISLLKLKR